MTGGMSDPALVQTIKDNGDKVVCQKVCMAFNEPKDEDCGMDTKFRVNLFGQ